MPLPAHMFIANDGDLYDTRVQGWGTLPPLRSAYRYHFRKIDTVAQLKATLRAGDKTWPGFYPLFLIMADGEAMSFESARKEFRQIADAIRSNDTRSGWRVTGCEINYEDSELLCCHSGERIPSAYGDD